MSTEDQKTVPPEGREAIGLSASDIKNFQREQSEKKNIEVREKLSDMKGLVAELERMAKTGDRQMIEKIATLIGGIDVGSFREQMVAMKVDSEDTFTGEQKEGGGIMEKLISDVQSRMPQLFEAGGKYKFNDPGHVAYWFARELRKEQINVICSAEMEREQIKEIK
jgi:hypothetical protein